jgi:hypothetical protein
MTVVAVADPAVMGALAVATRILGTGSALAGIAHAQTRATAQSAAAEPLPTDHADTVGNPMFPAESLSIILGRQNMRPP